MRTQIAIAEQRSGNKLVSHRFHNPHRIEHSRKQTCVKHRSTAPRIVQFSPHPALF